MTGIDAVKANPLAEDIDGFATTLAPQIVGDEVQIDAVVRIDAIAGAGWTL